MKKRRVDVQKEQLWRDRVKRQQQSGLSIRTFCAKESISEASFHWWRRELADRAARDEYEPSAQRREASPRRGGQRGRPFAKSAAETRLVPVTVTPSPPCATIEIALPGGVIVRVVQGCSGQLLREVLGALEVS